MVKSKEHEEGNRLFGEKKYDEAIACYSAAIALDPSFYVLYSNRSKSYLITIINCFLKFYCIIFISLNKFDLLDIIM